MFILFCIHFYFCNTVYSTLNITMERLFSPCNRLHDVTESQVRGGPPRRRLRELNLDVSTEDLLSAERAFTYADLYAVLGDRETAAWLTPRAFVASAGEIIMYYRLDFPRLYSFSCSCSADGKKNVAFALSHEYLLEICDVVLRLMAASVVHSAILDKTSPSDSASMSASILAHMMEGAVPKSDFFYVEEYGNG
jgi:hypothetical protein